MKKILNFIVIFLLFTSNIFAADDIEKDKTLLKSLFKKSLTKEETISFLKEYAIILEDERSDGEVTYVFDDENYIRYKGIEVISTDAWRFSKLGALRLFNKDVKLTWKIKPKTKKTENLINIKTKFDPVGKLYKFTVMDKKDFLDQIEQIKLAEKQKKEAAKKAETEKKKKQEEKKLAAEQKLEEEKRKLEEERLAAEQKLEEEKRKLEEERLAAEQKLEEKKRKLEEERLAAEQKLEEEKRKLEEEKLALQKEIEELKMKKVEELEKNKKTPEQIKKEERERIKQEKLVAKQIAKEEKERIKQEKLAAKKKAKEEKERKKQEELAENKRLEQEKLEAKEKAEAKKLVEEKQKKIIAATDWNKMLDYIANRLMLTSQSSPGIGEFQLLNCMMNTMKPEYLSGTFLFDGMYDRGPRKDIYYKMKKNFDDIDNDILKKSVNCSSAINQFAR